MLLTLTRNWWVLLLRGIAGIVLGLLAFIWPIASLYALVIFYGAYAIVDGISALSWGFANRGDRESQWAMIAVGTLGVLAGAVALLWPGITALALLVLIAAWSIVKGAFEIAAAIRLRKVIEDEWLLAAGGVFSILFGGLLIVWPGIGLLTLVWVAAIYLVVFGALMVALSFKLRALKGTAEGGRPFATAARA